jgi:hypothetical protein
MMETIQLRVLKPGARVQEFAERALWRRSAVMLADAEPAVPGWRMAVDELFG